MQQQQQRSTLVVVRASESPLDYEEPETAKEGIDLGLVLCKQGRCVSSGLVRYTSMRSTPVSVSHALVCNPTVICAGGRTPWRCLKSL